MIKVEKVKFKDGTFGVRQTTGRFFKEYKFKDLHNKTNDFWWSNTSNWFSLSCKQPEKVVDNYISDLYDFGEVVK